MKIIIFPTIILTVFGLVMMGIVMEAMWRDVFFGVFLLP